MLDRHAQRARFVDHHGKLCGRKGDALPRRGLAEFLLGRVGCSLPLWWLRGRARPERAAEFVGKGNPRGLRLRSLCGFGHARCAAEPVLRCGPCMDRGADHPATASPLRGCRAADALCIRAPRSWRDLRARFSARLPPSGARPGVLPAMALAPQAPASRFAAPGGWLRGGILRRSSASLARGVFCRDGVVELAGLATGRPVLRRPEAGGPCWPGSVSG